MLKAKSSSPLSNISWSFLKKPKVLGLIVFFIILAALPVALYEVQQQQEIRQHAQSGGLTQDSCHLVSVTFTETPAACATNPNQAGNTSFTSYNVKANISLINSLPSGSHITLDWDAASFFCATLADVDQTASNHPCLKNEQLASNQSCTITNDSNTCTNLQIPVNKPNGQYAGLACGYYQTDFAFNFHVGSYGGNGCHFGSVVPVETSPGGYTFCNAGNCTFTPTPTVTPTITNTPTPTLPIDTPTDTLTPPPSSTPTPTSSPSATPTFTITPTFTVTPTGTLTPTVSPTPTPTGTTPPPTNTPPPTIIVVKPTLPPTGPSNTIVAVGLVGVAISVLGLALLIGI